MASGMGSINPDRLSPPPGPELALTLAEMHVARWELRATCRRCSTVLRADVGVMIKAWGPDTVWWGRSPRCPVWECPGRLTYAARSVSGGTWRSMAEPAPARLVEIWTAKRRGRQREPR
jgi:hypothetical protein